MLRLLVLAFGACALAACGRGPSADEDETSNLSSARQELVHAHLDAFGFEDLNAWNITNGTGTKALTQIHSQGQQAFALKLNGWTELETVNLPTLDLSPDHLYLDVRLPRTQSNPSWFGAVQVYVSIPSQGVWHEYVGQESLDGRPLEQFSTLTFTFPTNIKQALAKSYSDLKIHLALNVPGGNDAYVIDNLRFQYTPSEPAPRSPALTQLLSDTFGFEVLDDWAFTNGTGSKSLTSLHTQGKQAFRLALGGWTELESRSLPSVRQTPEAFYLDFRLPPNQSNQWWYGAVQLYVSIPSQSIWRQYLGQQELTGLGLEQFHTLSFRIPSEVQAALGKEYDDLKVLIAFNVPAGNGPYFIDALRFQPEIASDPRPACHPSINGLANGDMRYEYRGQIGETVGVEVRRNGSVIATQTLTEPLVEYSDGQALFAFVHGKQNYSAGDEISVRFTSAAAPRCQAEYVWISGNDYRGGERVRYGNPATVYESRVGHRSKIDEPPPGQPELWQIANDCIGRDWTTSTAYRAGNVVTHAGVNYEALQSHTSEIGHDPSTLPLVWKLTTKPPSAELPLPPPVVGPWSAPFTYGPYVECRPKLDPDGDGPENSEDVCPSDPLKSEPGFCGCNRLETNSDGDALPDCVDQCRYDARKLDSGDCGCAGSYAPVGAQCTDPPLVALAQCNATGACGDIHTGQPSWVPEGQIQQLEYRDKIYLVIRATTSWDNAQRTAPAAYRLARVEGEEQNALLRALTNQLGPDAKLWLDGHVDAPGIISHTGPRGVTEGTLWNDAAAPKNVDLQFTSWDSGQPSSTANTGCVLLSTTGKWQVADCSEPHYIIYERPKGTLVPTTGAPITCSDFPDLKCRPNLPPGSEPCVAGDQEDVACQTCLGNLASDPDDPNNHECDAVCPKLVCKRCLDRHGCTCEDGDENCSCDLSQCADECPDVPASPVPTACPIDYGTTCELPFAGEQSCQTSAECANPGEVCGIVHTPEGEDALRCGVPDESCKLRPAQGPQFCTDVLICSDPGSEGSPDALGPDLAPMVEPAPFSPADRFSTPVPENNQKFPSESESYTDVPARDGSGPVHPWCQYEEPALPNQTVEDAKSGKAGKGSALKFDIDPNIRVHYEASALPLGQLKFKVEAQASLKASATVNLPQFAKTFDILDAALKASVNRCGFTTNGSHLVLLDRDFLPDLVPELAKLNRQDQACEYAVAAFEEVADRAKKAMHDARELLRQYHEAAKNGRCLDPAALCRELVEGLPSGYPSFDCSKGDIAVEDIINLYIFNYHRLLNLKGLSLPPLPKGIDALRLVNGAAPDRRLPGLEKALDALDSLSTADLPNLGPLPSLSDAATALSEFKPALPTHDKNWLDQYGCGEQAHAERHTLFQKPFSLGPIPMLLEVQSVVRYGLGGKLSYTFKPDQLAQLVSSSGTSQTGSGANSEIEVASVSANARPCVSAGIGLFVGAGFKGYGFRATAGVEGVLNLGTLSFPANTTASINVSAVDEALTLSPPSVVSENTVAREIADDLKGLWDGQELPIKQRRFRVRLGYSYGLSAKADQILAGHLRAALEIKFWRWKRRWSKYLLNFGNGISLGEHQLLSGGDSFALSGKVPWGTLQMPSPFVKFKYLDRISSSVLGLAKSELYSSLGDLKIPLSQLANLPGFSLGSLPSISIPRTDLPSLAKELGFRDLAGELQARGVALGDMRLADLAKLGFDLPALNRVPLELTDLAALNLSLDDLLRLGIDLPALSLDRLDFSGLSVADLGKLGGASSALAFDWRDLPELSYLLHLPDLDQQLLDAGVDLSDLHLSDFQKIGLKLGDFRGWPLNARDIRGLGLKTPDLRKLGLDLSGISLTMDGDPSVLEQRGLDLSGLTLARLSELGLSLADLDEVHIDLDRLLDISLALNIPDLQSALINAGANIDSLTIADFSRLGVGADAFSRFSFSPAQLNLGASDLIKLGYGAELNRIGSYVTGCPSNQQVGLDKGPVGEFGWDKKCCRNCY